MPNLGKILSNGSWSRALPSIPTVTSVNWTTMVTGLHCGTHGRPYSKDKVGYFWEAAENKNIPVGLANIEHNEVGEGSFFVGHARILAEPDNKPLKDGETISFEISAPEGISLATVECTLSDSLKVKIEGNTRSCVHAAPDKMSRHAIFRASDEEHTEVCTTFRYVSPSSSVYISPLRTMSGFAEPSRIEKKVIGIAGPPPVKGFPLFHHHQADLETAIMEETYHARWFGKIAGKMMADHEDALWFHRHNTTDGIGHYYLGLIDESAYCYEPENEEANWDALTRWYQTVDMLLGEIITVDPDARFAMCTDHGHVGYRRLISLAKLFVDEGLAQPDATRPMLMDPRTSKVLISAEEIFVNLDSRDPPGPVAQAEYEEVRDKVIETLVRLDDPENSSRPVALAIRKEYAQALSFWGRLRGDILFLLKGGYFATGSTISEDVFQQFRIPTNSSAHHGPFPGYETKIGSTFSFMAFSGCPGGERRIDELGVPHLVDFAPTVLAILGLGDRRLQGRVLWDMIAPGSAGSGEWIIKTPAEEGP